MIGHSKQLIATFISLKKEIKKSINEYLRPFGLNELGFHFLELLEGSLGKTMRELTEFFDVDKALTTRIVAGLVEKNFVQTTKQSAGQKKYAVFLTTTGQEALAQHKKNVDLIVKSFLPALTAEESQTLAIIQNKFAQKMQELKPKHS